eukprot:TRINITY_DN24235_c0_g1_i1.p1 TRINITY_DN24235_c0_g1~~TRINITY_DN24235_c0_g1_i1.p1  ORF type:complete len:297 (+),score=79.29 TRINITY_DN24235_c0_g1_i1:883-1773(+)
MLKLWTGIPPDFLSTEERKYFYAKLIDTYTRCGQPLRRYPVISGKMIDFFAMYDAAMQYGGFKGVVENGRWKDVAEAACGPEVVNASGLSASVKKNYIQYLQKLEDMFSFVQEGPDFLFSTYARRRAVPEAKAKASRRGGRGRGGRGRGARGGGSRASRLSLSQRGGTYPPPVPDFEESELQVALAISEVQVLKTVVAETAKQFSELEKQLYSALGHLSEDMLGEIQKLKQDTSKLLDATNQQLAELERFIIESEREQKKKSEQQQKQASPRRQSPRLRQQQQEQLQSPSKKRKLQ